MERKNGIREEAAVLRLLALLIQSGVQIVQALGPVGEAFPRFKVPLDRINDRLNAGKTGLELFEGLDAYFSGFVPQMYRYGEMGGSIDRTLITASEILHSTLNVQNPLPISERDLNEVNYYRLFGSLIGNGSPLLGALDIAAKEYLHPSVAARVSDTVRKGESLVNAFEAGGDFFSKIGVSFVDVGEQTGSLPEACRQFADLKESYLLACCVGSETAAEFLKPERILEYGHLSFLTIGHYLDVSYALNIVSKAAVPERKLVFEKLAEKVKLGSPLAEAMKSMPDDFPSWITLLVSKATDSLERGVFLNVTKFIASFPA